MKKYNNGMLNYVNGMSIEELRLKGQELIDNLHSRENLHDIFDVLIDRLEEAELQRNAAFEALKQAKKTLKKALKMIKPKEDEEHKPEDCRYYVDQWLYGVQGRCIGTMEMDPCKGENCPNWKPKEESK